MIIIINTGEVEEERLDEKMAREFIGGYGLGARMLFELQKAGIEPLGPENILALRRDR